MKQAIVLGASSGMGRKVSEMLLKEGWHVGVAARRMEALNELAESFPERVEVMQIDVMAEDAPQRLLELIDKVGGVDLYFHASGIGKQNMLLDEEVERKTVMTNAWGFTRMVDTVFNYMATHQGGQYCGSSLRLQEQRGWALLRRIVPPRLFRTCISSR